MKYIIISLAILTVPILGLAVQYHNNQQREMTRLQGVLISLTKAASVIRKNEEHVAETQASKNQNSSSKYTNLLHSKQH